MCFSSDYRSPVADGARPVSSLPWRQRLLARISRPIQWTATFVDRPLPRTPPNIPGCPKDCPLSMRVDISFLLGAVHCGCQRCVDNEPSNSRPTLVQSGAHPTHKAKRRRASPRLVHRAFGKPRSRGFRRPPCPRQRRWPSQIPDVLTVRALAALHRRQIPLLQPLGRLGLSFELSATGARSIRNFNVFRKAWMVRSSWADTLDRPEYW